MRISLTLYQNITSTLNTHSLPFSLSPSEKKREKPALPVQSARMP